MTLAVPVCRAKLRVEELNSRFHRHSNSCTTAFFVFEAGLAANGRGAVKSDTSFG